MKHSLKDLADYYDSLGWHKCNLKQSYISKWRTKLKNGDILSVRGVGEKQLTHEERQAKEGQFLTHLDNLL